MNKDIIPLMLLPEAMGMAGTPLSKGVFGITKIESKEISPEVKRSRKLKKLECRQNKDIVQEAKIKGHEIRIRKMKESRFIKHRRNLKNYIIVGG